MLPLCVCEEAGQGIAEAITELRGPFSLNSLVLYPQVQRTEVSPGRAKSLVITWPCLQLQLHIIVAIQGLSTSSSYTLVYT